ncbi:hypothetical protein UCDDS831_g08583 [Diplodia seriata]|uniref:Uncharacterized protein n=1 Tax=Diplodia seriata TaxID=420778 RepID=A0A0G2FPQ4_9PEZI|nr:hypothetical protein UCDDS831_g08583 [Diplodia seriata]
MVIPARNQPQQAPPPARTRGPHSSCKHRSASEHHPNTVPPAVAALLAVTSIPRPRRASSPRRRLQYADRRISIDELIEEWRAEDKEISPGSYGSPLDILLERVEDCDTDDSLSFEDASQKERNFVSPRSISSESIPSVPDLDEDRSALKSAAKSFSNFTAPSVPPEDLLTRSLLSPRFASEMRPKNFQGTPDPALRRYLNPSTSNRALSPTELSQQLHEALLHGQPVDDPGDGPMIQMQTYERRSRSQSRGKRRTTDPASEAGRALSPQPAVRQREPRENSDFLRVIVLEMNMRREGKLDARAMGKARIWLPPRKTSARSEEEDAVNGVPVRWAVILA